jgi:hypothetical protein
MAFGLKGILRSWGPDLVCVSGDFIVNATPAIASIRPHNIAGFTLSRKAAGVYTVTMDQAFASVISTDVGLGPATTIGTGALPTAQPMAVMISKDFLNASATNYVADTTGKILLIIGTLSAALTELTVNYRCSFDTVMAESALNN